MIDGVELFQLRQRRSANGDTFFTGRLGNAFVILVRDGIERDVWRMFATDPCQTNSDHPSLARIAAPTNNDGWYRGELNDDPPDDLIASQDDCEAR